MRGLVRLVKSRQIDPFLRNFDSVLREQRKNRRRVRQRESAPRKNCPRIRKKPRKEVGIDVFTALFPAIKPN